MIFVALGTQKFQLNRLLKEIDNLIEKGVITEEVFAQIGESNYIPQRYEYEKFMSKEQFEEKISGCDILITHGGVGTIVAGLKRNKKVIVFPRLKKYGEHVDDHQLEIAKSFSQLNYVLECDDADDLEKVFCESEEEKFSRYVSQREIVVGTIREFLDTCNNECKMEKKINILMCSSDLSTKGGMVSVVKNYIRYTNWDKYNIIHCPTHKDGSKIMVTIYFFFAYIRLVFNLLTKKIDVAHLHTAERGSFFRKAIVLRTLKIFGIKALMHHHAAEFEEFYARLSRGKKKFVNKTLEMADINVVLSNSLVPMIKEKSPNARVEVLYNAVNTYEEKPYNTDAKNILFLGRLGERKGTYDLLEAIKRLDKKIDTDIKFYLCGDGEIDEVTQKVKELGMEHRIAHIGWIDGEQKKEFLKNTCVNVLPSYNEGLPMTILETMSYGIPNISTNIASIPEVIKDGETGYLIEPGDIDGLCESILKCVSDKEKLLQFSQNSYELIKQNFALDKHIEKLVVWYEELSD